MLDLAFAWGFAFAGTKKDPDHSSEVISLLILELVSLKQTQGVGLEIELFYADITTDFSTV